MPKAETGFRGISLKTELVEAIEKFMKEYGMGYKSVSDFVHEAARVRMETIRKMYGPVLPILEHYNIDEEQGCVRVMDHKNEVIADVCFSYEGVKCEACNSRSCEHVKYALNLPKVVKILRKHGWEIEDGEIIRKP